ncbi:hypothetical protein BU25DRAFT_469934 [Macroventuria anomochaeta]|uniref:Uncharacterized protein n=1 Tax=Macroventuria anomochaeta TaxID=301207 RepID=A0ACB6RXV4_9PLEO|nr:uncharacterized protein BU25DRAFT_469934 [Macroventuria anomochaeta]KAF2626871.1 hypothetical protein BU25DRAFT_469934 [Macroventuria anomochaeta]
MACVKTARLSGSGSESKAGHVPQVAGGSGTAAVDAANQRVDPEARSFWCCCCASTSVGERLLRFVHARVPPYEAPSPAPWAPAPFHASDAALDLHVSNLVVFAQSPEVPIVHQGPAALLASHPPVPPLFPLESLKQASGLGPRTALVNWAWSVAGASRPPSCFKYGRLFAELGTRGLHERSPMLLLPSTLGPSFLSQLSDRSFL